MIWFNEMVTRCVEPKSSAGVQRRSATDAASNFVNVKFNSFVVIFIHFFLFISLFGWKFSVQNYIHLEFYSTFRREALWEALYIRTIVIDHVILLDPLEPLLL